jgi:hypothetical protein
LSLVELRRGGFVAGELESDMVLLPWSLKEGKFWDFTVLTYLLRFVTYAHHFRWIKYEQSRTIIFVYMIPTNCINVTRVFLS